MAPIQRLGSRLLLCIKGLELLGGWIVIQKHRGEEEEEEGTPIIHSIGCSIAKPLKPPTHKETECIEARVDCFILLAFCRFGGWGGGLLWGSAPRPYSPHLAPCLVHHLSYQLALSQRHHGALSQP